MVKTMVPRMWAAWLGEDARQMVALYGNAIGPVVTDADAAKLERAVEAAKALRECFNDPVVCGKLRQLSDREQDALRLRTSAFDAALREIDGGGECS